MSHLPVDSGIGLLVEVEALHVAQYLVVKLNVEGENESPSTLEKG
jgi:hypothetical protein